MAEETAEEKAKREAAEKAEAEETARIEREKAEEAERTKKVTLESLSKQIDDLCTRFDYFAELVLDSEAIVDEIVIEAATPPDEHAMTAPTAPTPPETKKETVSQETERQRRHKLT